MPRRERREPLKELHVPPKRKLNKREKIRADLLESSIRYKLRRMDKRKKVHGVVDYDRGEIAGDTARLNRLRRK